jgi:signal transduction histidine kinase
MMSLRHRFIVELVSLIALITVTGCVCIYLFFVWSPFHQSIDPHFLDQLRQLLILVVSMSIGSTVMAAWMYAGRIADAIESIAMQAERISLNTDHLKLEYKGNKTELTYLTQSLNGMLGRLKESYQIQKNFIANASHETRTPLTAAILQLEVILSRNIPEPDVRRVLTSVLEDLRNLNTLTDRLLLLAYTSNDRCQHESRYTPVRIDELICDIAGTLQRYHPGYQITITFDERWFTAEERLTVKGDHHLLRTALLNLMENACKYSPSHSVVVKVWYYPIYLTIQVINEGRLGKEELLHLFEPFYRGNNVQQKRGHGIGLSIVDKISTLHKGAIRARSNNNQVVLTLRLPLYGFY